METGSTTRRRVWDWLFSVVIIVAVIGYYIFHWKSVNGFVVAIDQCKTLFCDFFGHFYPMGQEILVTFQPVNRFYYSPFAAILI